MGLLARQQVDEAWNRGLEERSCKDRLGHHIIVDLVSRGEKTMEGDGQDVGVWVMVEWVLNKVVDGLVGAMLVDGEGRKLVLGDRYYISIDRKILVRVTRDASESETPSAKGPKKYMRLVPFQIRQ